MKLVNEKTSMKKRISHYNRIVRVISTIVIGAIAPLTMVPSAQAVELLKLLVSETGFQKVRFEDLPSDFNLRGIKHNNLHILLNGKVIPTQIKGQGNGRNWKGRFFGPGAYITFYGEAADNLYSEENVYELHYLNNRGLKKQSLKRKKFFMNRTWVNKKRPASNTYTHKVIVEQDNYYEFAAPSKTDPWHFGQNFSFFPTPSYDFDLTDVTGGSANASISAQMYGLLDFGIEGNDHHYELVLNGNVLGDQQFDGNSADTFTASNAVVNEGTNTVKYNYKAIEGVPFDVIALNRVEVTYPRYTKAIDNYLEGDFAPGHHTVTGISKGDFKVYKINVGPNGENVQEMIRAQRNKDGSIRFNAGRTAAKFAIVGEGNKTEETGFKKPQIKKLLVKQNIKRGNAEYLILANKALMGEELDRLVDLRSQRYAVKVVDVQQVYSQFGNSLPDAAAIDRYIKYAASRLGTRYVALIGSDTYDYKGIGNTGSVSLIPTAYVVTNGSQGEGQLYSTQVSQTPSDASYGDLDDDGVPDLPVGRITARTTEELRSVVNKLIAYEQRTGYAGRVLVAADKEDNGNGVSFTQDAEDLIQSMPKAWRDSIRADFKAYPDVDGDQLAHDKTIRAINAGVSVVNYIGHSSQSRWGFTSPPVLRAAEIASLTNEGKPALITQWGCWNSYYVDPAGNAMSDLFLVNGENGAATVLGASTLTSSIGERDLGVELNKRMYTEGVTIGDAVIQAKKALAEKKNYPDIQLGWQIIGDPALMVDPF